MRVAIIGANKFDTIEYNFWETFNYLGHTAKIFDESRIAAALDTKSRKVINAMSNYNYSFAKWAYTKLSHIVLKYEPELVIITYRHVIPEFVKKLKKSLKKTPVIHINPDHVGTLGRQYLIVSPYDAYFTKEPFWADTMRNKLGLNAYYLPESFNPRVHSLPNCEKKHFEQQTGVDIAVAATLYPYRVRFLETLLKMLPETLSMKIYGDIPRWVSTKLVKYHAGKPILGTEKAELFFGAKIVLNNMHLCEYEGVNCRFFEILGCGGFQLCDDKSALSDLAVPDKEVVTFKSLEEAAEKIRYYLANNEQRWTIAEAGYQKANKEHTYEKRIETIFSVIS